jgi:hypothetical protein
MCCQISDGSPRLPTTLLTSRNRRSSTLDNRCCPMCDNFLYVFKGTPSARQAVQPRPDSGHGARLPRAAWDRRGCRCEALRWRGVSPLVGGGQARCLSVGTHGAGRRRSVRGHEKVPACGQV